VDDVDKEEEDVKPDIAPSIQATLNLVFGEKGSATHNIDRTIVKEEQEFVMAHR